MAEIRIVLPSAVAMAASLAKFVSPLELQAEKPFYDFLFAQAGREVSVKEFLDLALEALTRFRGRHLRVDKHVEALAGRENTWFADKVNHVLAQMGAAKTENSTIQLLR